MNKKARRIALLGLCTSLALVLAYVEVLIPPLYAAVPGIKLGLPNIVIIFVLYKFGFPSAVSVSLIRIILVSSIFGNAMSFAYSVAGAVLSLALMAVLKGTGKFSVVGVSVVGGIFHNVGQILMAMYLFRTVQLGYYLVVLSVTGTVSGILIGLCGATIIKRIKV